MSGTIDLNKAKINMSIYAIAAASLLYLVCAVDNFRQGDYPHCLVWFSYALANMGLLWYEYNKHASN
jgi:hypothetical protein